MPRDGQFVALDTGHHTYRHRVAAFALNVTRGEETRGPDSSRHAGIFSLALIENESQGNRCPRPRVRPTFPASLLSPRLGAYGLDHEDRGAFPSAMAPRLQLPWTPAARSALSHAEVTPARR